MLATKPSGQTIPPVMDMSDGSWQGRHLILSGHKMWQGGHPFMPQGLRSFASIDGPPAPKNPNAKKSLQ